MIPDFTQWLQRGKSAPPKRRGMRRISKKLAARKRVYVDLVAQFLKEHPYCQVVLRNHGVIESTIKAKYVYDEGYLIVADFLYEGRAGIFEGWVPKSVEIHHMNKRFGSRLNDTSEWLAVCRDSHEWIENNKALARERGFLKNI